MNVHAPYYSTDPDFEEQEFIHDLIELVIYPGVDFVELRICLDSLLKK